jgi:hypothetical protein
MSSQFIEKYNFGKIIINGKAYANDVILLGEKIIPNWWRKKGHNLLKQDLEKIIEYKPQLLIIGKGNNGRMRVPNALHKKLEFNIESYKTDRAVRRYNQALEEGIRVAGGFHLTC